MVSRIRCARALITWAPVADAAAALAAVAVVVAATAAIGRAAVAVRVVAVAVAVVATVVVVAVAVRSAADRGPHHEQISSRLNFDQQKRRLGAFFSFYAALIGAATSLRLQVGRSDLDGQLLHQRLEVLVVALHRLGELRCVQIRKTEVQLVELLTQHRLVGGLARGSA